jgi:hypothetical protein
MQEVTRAPDLTVQILKELYIALERLRTDEELLSIVGSWRDTMPDAEVLALLREYNTTEQAPQRTQ